MDDVSFGNVNRILRPHLKNMDIQLCADRFKLLDSCGAVNIARYKQRTFALLFAHQRCQLRAVRRFTGALKPDKHDYGRRLRCYFYFGVCAAHEGAELLIDDFYDHLGRREAFKNLFADGARADGAYKVLDDLIADVSFQERQTNLTYGLFNVGFVQPAFAAQFLKNGIQFLG